MAYDDKPYISYSGFKAYVECPRQYWYRYVGKPAIQQPDNRVNMLYGSVVGTLFERFYVEKAWRSPSPEGVLNGWVEPVLQETVTRETREGVVRWKSQDRMAMYDSRESLVADVRAAIPRGVEIIRRHRLVGLDSRAEVKLDGHLEGCTIAGRADFIVKRLAPDRDVVILDGKGTKHRDSVDVKQLFWYGNLFRHKVGRYPNKLGFIFWRAEPEDALAWVELVPDAMATFQVEVISTVRDIQAKKLLPLVGGSPGGNFPAKPGEKKCDYCGYLPLCQEGKAYFANKAAAKKVRQGFPSGVGEEGLDGIGLDEF